MNVDIKTLSDALTALIAANLLTVDQAQNILKDFLATQKYVIKDTPIQPEKAVDTITNG